MRLGILGGSFDPIHIGHLLMARMALEELRLDRVLLIPSARPPHKLRRRQTPARHRMAMVRAATRGLSGFAVSDLELRRRGPSYTVDTVEALCRRHPGVSMTLIVGQDMLSEIGRWHEARRLLRQVTLAVYPRPGARGRGPRCRRRWIHGPRLDVSAREIRRRVRARRSITYWVPAPVEKYIYSRRLYR